MKETMGTNTVWKARDLRDVKIQLVEQNVSWPEDAALAGGWDEA